MLYPAFDDRLTLSFVGTVFDYQGFDSVIVAFLQSAAYLKYSLLSADDCFVSRGKARPAKEIESFDWIMSLPLSGQRLPVSKQMYTAKGIGKPFRVPPDNVHQTFDSPRGDDIQGEDLVTEEGVYSDSICARDAVY